MGQKCEANLLVYGVDSSFNKFLIKIDILYFIMLFLRMKEHISLSNVICFKLTVFLKFQSKLLAITSYRPIFGYCNNTDTILFLVIIVTKCHSSTVIN